MLNLDDLVGPLAAQPGFSSLKKSARALATTGEASKGASRRGGDALSAPLPAAVKERLDRQAAYAATKEEADKWQATTKRIREAEHLSFPLQREAKAQASTSQLVANHKVTDGLEKAVSDLLKEGRWSEKELQEKEELAMKELTPEEVSARRAELRKMRDLLFREERKAKRAAKIKSKVYRKIARRRKEKEKLALDQLDQLDPEMAKEERQKLEVARARERATMKHKNTKWAKGLSGRHELHDDARQAVGEQFARHELLRRKIQGMADQDDSDETGGSSDGEEAEREEEDALDDEEYRALVKAKAFDELAAVAAEAEEDGSAVGSGRKGALMNMKFMREARARETARTKDMAEEMMSELEGLGSEDEEGNGNEETDAAATAMSYMQVSGNRGRKVFGAGQASSTSSRLPASPPAPPPAPIPVGTTEESVKDKKRKPTAAELIRDDAKVEIDLTNLLKPSDKPSDSRDKGKTVARAENAKVKAKGKAKSREGATGIGSNKPEGAHENAPSGSVHVDAAYQESESEEEEAADEPIQVGRSKAAFRQRELVAEAFANDNVVEDFEEEKRRIIEEDAPKEENLTLPGWGTWGGKGVKRNRSSASSSSRKRVRHIPGVDPSARKDAKMSNVIINEKRDKKADKYRAKDLPYPYTSAAQYEASLRQPIGPEFNTRTTHQKLTLPRVTTQLGKVIDPIERLF